MPLGDRLETVILLQKIQPLIQPLVQLGVADENEELLVGFGNQLA
jgi:hypothetical protein